MEVITLSKQALHEDFSACKDLASFIGEIESQLHRVSKVLCKIKVNGLLLTEEDEIRLATTRLSEIDFVELECRDESHLLEDAARDLEAWVVEFKAVLVAQSDKIRKEGAISAYDFSQVVKNMSWLVQAIQAIKAHCAETESWVAVEGQMSRAVLELESAYKSQDQILIADVMEYEIFSALDQWRVLLASVRGSGSK